LNIYLIGKTFVFEVKVELLLLESLLDSDWEYQTEHVVKVLEIGVNGNCSW